MRPSHSSQLLASLARSVLLRESSSSAGDDAADRPPDPAEGEIGEEVGLTSDPLRTDDFLLARDVDVDDAERIGRALVRRDGALDADERQTYLSDAERLGWKGALLAYLNRLQARPLTHRELCFITDEEQEAGLPSTGGVGLSLRPLYQRSVSWCLLTSRFVDEIDSLLASVGAKRIVEVAAGRGSLAQIMRARGFSWRAFDASSVSSPGVVRSSASRVLSSLRPGSCDAIAVSWAHFADDWDVDILDASERLGVPVVTITAEPDVVTKNSGLHRNMVSAKPRNVSFTHSLPFWRRVESEFAVTKRDTREPGRRDVVLLLTPRALGSHPLPETAYHSAKAQHLLDEIFNDLVRSEGGATDEEMERISQYITSGGDRDGHDSYGGKDWRFKGVTHMILSLPAIQNAEAAARKGERMPPAREWVEDFLASCMPLRGKVSRDSWEPDLLESPVNGSWFNFDRVTLR